MASLDTSESPAPPPCTLGPLVSTVGDLNHALRYCSGPSDHQGLPGAWRAGPAGQLQRPLLPQLPALPAGAARAGPPMPAVCWKHQTFCLISESRQHLPPSRRSVLHQEGCPGHLWICGGSEPQSVRGESGSVCIDAHLPHALAVCCQFEQRNQDVTGHRQSTARR